MSDADKVIEVAYDPSTWVPIPREWPHDGCNGPRKWRRRVIRHVTERSGLLTRSQHRYLTTVLTSFASWGDEGELRYLYLPDVLAPVSLVRIQFGEAGGPLDETLRMIAGSTDMQPLEPPEMTQFAATGLGEGVRAIHTTVMPKDEDAGDVPIRSGEAVTVWAVYAFRKEPYDIRISCPADSLVTLLGLLPALEEFVHGVDVVPALS